MTAVWLAQFGPGAVFGAAMLLCAMVTTWAGLLPAARRRAPACPAETRSAPWSALLAPHHRRLIAVASTVLVVIALAAGLGPAMRPAPMPPATPDGRDFALIEREFVFRERLDQQRIALLRQAQQAEIAAIRERYQTEMAELRQAYERAIETLPANVERLVRRIGEQFGLNPDFFARITAIESGFNPTIANALSGARGLFQFMPDTWNTIGARHAAEIAAMGLTYEPVTPENRGQTSDPRNNARLNAVMGAFLTRAGLQALNSNDPAILYIAHFAGPTMAAYIRDNHQTNPDRLIREVLREIFPTFAEAIIEQNAPAYTETTTVRNFYDWSAGHFRGIATALLIPPPDAGGSTPAPGTPALTGPGQANQTPAPP